MSSRISHAALGGALVLVGCGGNTVMHLGDTGNGGASASAGGQGGTQFTSGAGGSDTTVSMDAGPARACAPNAGQSVPLMLTNPEYDRTVRDLLGDSSAPSPEFPRDLSPNGFRAEPAEIADQTRIAHYFKTAGDLASTAASHLDRVLPCNPTMVGDDACASTFISTFGRRAYRRPLTPAEVADLRMTYQGAKATGAFSGGIQAVIAALLRSPHFYYVEEKGTSTTPAPLGPFQLASRLSYFIYRSMPDDQLLSAAELGKLGTKADVEREARRMLADPKAHDGVLDFFSEWLELGRLAFATKDQALFPTFDSLRGDMATETTKFVESIFFGDGLLKTLLQSSKTWVNAPLANLYGQAGIIGAFQQVQLDPKQRAGILTQASFLATRSGSSDGSPPRRGIFVRDKLLCQPVPPPPPSQNMPLPDLGPNATNRMRYMAAQTEPSCAGCHRLFDPIGYGLEAFDAIGQFRVTDHGLPVDSSGEIFNAGDSAEGPFNGAIDLASKLATSTTVQECTTKQWFRFALSRSEEEGDACSLEVATSALQSSGNLRELVVSLVTSDSFRYARW